MLVGGFNPSGIFLVVGWGTLTSHHPLPPTHTLAAPAAGSLGAKLILPASGRCSLFYLDVLLEDRVKG